MPTREARRAEWLTRASGIAVPLLPHATEADVLEGLRRALPYWTTSRRDASAAAAKPWNVPCEAAERVLVAVAQGTACAAQPVATVTDLRAWSLRRGAPKPPPGAVRVDRKTPYGNPFQMDTPGCVRDGTRDEVIQKFRDWISSEDPKAVALLAQARRELRGKHLLCWCAPEACHADVWIELVNGPEAIAA
jgi:hypothetical protein